MTRQAIRYVLYSQMSFGATVMSLLLISPEALTSRSGISYYGNFRDTLIPYMAGLGLCGYFLIKAANSVPHTGRKPDMIRLALRVSALALIGIIITPSFASKFTGFWHGTFACILFITQATVTWKLVADLWSNLIDRVLIVVQVLSIFAIVLSFTWIAIFDMMIPAQATAVTAFGILCIRLITRLEVDQDAFKPPPKQRGADSD